jgi:ArsR family transcriptional regulator, arsenate/arsenite/antimonite-responsive transcriptional repressor
MTTETTRILTGLKAIAEETRWRMIRLLLTQEWCGRALAQRLGISEAAVSQHLRILREAGLVEGEKRGYWVHYSVRKTALEEIVGEFQRILSKSEMPTGQCRRTQAKKRGYTGEEAKTMCNSCCEKPVMLKEKPEKCTFEQIKKCHGDEKDHPCTTDKKES